MDVSGCLSLPPSLYWTRPPVHYGAVLRGAPGRACHVVRAQLRGNSKVCEVKTDLGELRLQSTDRSHSWTGRNTVTQAGTDGLQIQTNFSGRQLSPEELELTT